jgi:uncharacterized protein
MAAFQSAILLLGIALGVGLSYAPNSGSDRVLKSATWWGSVGSDRQAEMGSMLFLSPAASLIMGVTLAFMMLGGVYWLSRMGWAWFSEIEALLDQALVPSLRRCRIWQLLMLAILAGVGEELLFRWAIQGWLEYFGRWAIVDVNYSQNTSRDFLNWLAYGFAATVTAILFGLCHAVTRAYWALAAGMGLIFSLVVVAGGGLVAAIVAHGLYDFLAFMWLCQRLEEKHGDGAENEFMVG